MSLCFQFLILSVCSWEKEQKALFIFLSSLFNNFLKVHISCLSCMCVCARALVCVCPAASFPRGSVLSSLPHIPTSTPICCTPWPTDVNWSHSRGSSSKHLQTLMRAQLNSRTFSFSLYDGTFLAYLELKILSRNAL